MSKADKKFTRLLILVFFLVLTATVFGCRSRKKSARIDSGMRTVMGTVARVVVVADDTETVKLAIENAMAELHRTDGLMSDYNDASELSRVNAEAFNKPVVVGAELFSVLSEAVEYSKKTNGAFDVTVGPMVDLWREAAAMNVTPDANKITATAARVGYDKLLLDAEKSTVRFAVKGMRLDLGGIAKGWGIDRAIDAMRAAGAKGGMVDVGGDIRCFAERGHTEIWRIGLQDPRHVDDSGNSCLLVLKLVNDAVATSGDYRRFAYIEGKKYSHIIDVKKAHGTDKLSSVTVIAPIAIQADALATAVSVMGSDKGIELIESIKGVEAILIDENAKITMTSGADEFIEKK